MVDSLAICKIFNSLKTKDKELINYPAMRHSLSIESGREKVLGYFKMDRRKDKRIAMKNALIAPRRFKTMLLNASIAASF